jgi:hypothetical protein
MLLVRYGGLACCAFLLSCDPTAELKGQLASADGGPVVGAEVRVDCPELCVHAVSDAEGRFSGSRIGDGCALGCLLHVKKKGYRSIEAEIRHYCAKQVGTKCTSIAADLVVDPSGIQRN